MHKNEKDKNITSDLRKKNAKTSKRPLKKFGKSFSI